MALLNNYCPLDFGLVRYASAWCSWGTREAKKTLKDEPWTPPNPHLKIDQRKQPVCPGLRVGQARIHRTDEKEGYVFKKKEKSLDSPEELRRAMREAR